MKLLIITQAIDLDDPTLSVYHSWVETIAAHAEQATVLCLKKGRNTFPQNIEVVSLGKESKPSRLSYAWKFFARIWQKRNEYDAVFVHMNQEYVLLGGWLWKLLGKRVYLWRNHYAGSLLTDIAAWFCKKVFYTSNSSYTAKFSNAVCMPVGVPLEKFIRMPAIERKARSILSLGRISPSKNIHLLIEAFDILKKEKVEFTASIYGSVLPADAEYEKKLYARVQELGLVEYVSFFSGIANDKAPEIYNAHEIFVNVSPQGMFDKTILEAAACECIVVTANKDAAGYLEQPLVIQSYGPAEIAKKLSHALEMDADTRTKNIKQERVFASYHSLNNLARRFVREMNPTLA
ncbi:MAG TPA: glycosyltransferase family 4 protein [Candidatus Paceibacterota bacterium]|nr:glycosyltransferase family 4 protein [Candidatus Paceibacterota bacterium]